MEKSLLSVLEYEAGAKSSLGCLANKMLEQGTPVGEIKNKLSHVVSMLVNENKISVMAGNRIVEDVIDVTKHVKEDDLVLPTTVAMAELLAECEGDHQEKAKRALAAGERYRTLMKELRDEIDPGKVVRHIVKDVNTIAKELDKGLPEIKLTETINSIKLDALMKRN